MLDPKWGDRLLTTTVLEPGHQAAADEIRQHLAGFAERGFISRHATPRHAKPSLFEFVERLPKTSIGKLKTI